MSSRPRTRSRSESISKSLEAVPLHENNAQKATQNTSAVKASKTAKKSDTDKQKNIFWGGDAGDIPQSDGLFNDILSGKWMIVPSSSLKILLFSYMLWANFALADWIIRKYIPDVKPLGDNPFAKLWFISYPLPWPHSRGSEIKYGKGLWDIAFLLHHIITFAFIRQAITLWLLRPLAIKLGIRGSKILRFQEQAYCIFYYGTAGIFGTFVMRGLPTWYFNTSEFWKTYPNWQMTPLMKYYYLLQFSYWLQQMFILAFKIEKPRKDYNELIAHHIVTLWLIGWSYGINLTYIGNAVFVTMDFSDVFLAIAKCINYAEGPKSSGIGSAGAFTVFVGVWTYLRHYMNFWILWSVWFEWDLIPTHARRFRPSLGVWLVEEFPWMKHQVFVPILLIQLLNIFWYFLIWRILIRSIRGVSLADDRSDDEEEEKEEGKKDL